MKAIIRRKEFPRENGEICGPIYWSVKEVNDVSPAILLAGEFKFIGYWREPDFNVLQGTIGIPCDVVICPCGMVTSSMSVIYDHWKLGHFDVPIYEEV